MSISFRRCKHLMKKWKIPEHYLKEIREGLDTSKGRAFIRKRFEDGMVVQFGEGKIVNVVLPPETSSESEDDGVESKTNKTQYYVVEISPDNMYCTINSKQIEGGEELLQCSSLKRAQDYADEYMRDKQESEHRFKRSQCSLNEQGLEIYTVDSAGNVTLEEEMTYDCYHDLDSSEHGDDSSSSN